MHQIYRSLFLPHVCAVFHSVLSTMIPSQWRGGGLQFQDANMLLVDPAANFSHVPTSANQSPKQNWYKFIQTLGNLACTKNFCPPKSLTINTRCFSLRVENFHRVPTAARFRHCSRPTGSQHQLIPKDWEYLSCERFNEVSPMRPPEIATGPRVRCHVETNLPLFKDRKIPSCGVYIYIYIYWRG